MITPSAGHFLALGAVLFCISVAGIFINRKNVIVLLMCIELMLLAVNINFVAFSRFLGDAAGQVFVFFILTVAAAEAAIGLAILVTLFRNRRTINVAEHRHVEGLTDAGRRTSDLEVLLLHRARAAARRDRRRPVRQADRPRRRAHGHDRSASRSAACCRSTCCGSWSGRARRRSTRTSTPGSRSAALQAHVGFMVDRLTAMMMVVVTFVSLLVHVYTIGYMADDPGYQRFFSYISLFTFSMLMLVMSNNFLQLFFGWEAVGLVSYLLIGFWFKRPSAIFANLKAFLVNRVGDFGFLLGIAGVLFWFGTLDYAHRVRQRADASPARPCRSLRAAIDVVGADAASASACSSARWASRRRCRCTCGCRTRWKARRRSPR